MGPIPRPFRARVRLARPVGSYLKVDHLGPIVRFRMARTWLGTPFYVTACYRWGDALLDAGCPAARKTFLGHPDAKGLNHVLVTHHHEDHGGLAGDLERNGARVLASEEALREMRNGFRIHPYRKVVWGTPERARGEPLPSSGRFVAGGRDWIAVAAPGHSPDHVVFLDEAEHRAFTGDVYFGRVRTARSDEDVVTEVATLERLRDLEPAQLFPAHRGVVEQPKKALTEAIDHYETLGRKAKAMRAKGRSIPAIRRELLGRETTMHYASLGHFSADYLIRGVLGLPD